MISIKKKEGKERKRRVLLETDWVGCGGQEQNCGH